MSTLITGDPDSFPTSFPIPSDGDPRNASSVGVPFEALADRTANLAARIEPREYVFTEDGTFTVPDGVTSLDSLTLIGGGGGGGAGQPGASSDDQFALGGSGGAGGQVVQLQSVPVTPGHVLTITVGAGGVGGSALSNGAAGSSSGVLDDATALGVAAGGGPGYFGAGGAVADTAMSVVPGVGTEVASYPRTDITVIDTDDVVFPRPLSAGGWGLASTNQADASAGLGCPSSIGGQGGVGGSVGADVSLKRGGGGGGGGGGGLLGTTAGRGGDGAAARSSGSGDPGGTGHSALPGTGAGGGGGGGGGAGPSGGGASGPGGEGGSGCVVIRYRGPAAVIA